MLAIGSRGREFGLVLRDRAARLWVLVDRVRHADYLYGVRLEQVS
jgi:hypothetical protein